MEPFEIEELKRVNLDEIVRALRECPPRRDASKIEI
jgi:hypothetical protein